VFSSRLRREIRDRSTDAESVMVSASRILGDLSKNFALVYGSVLQESHISKIRLVELDRERVLVDVSVTPENENTVVLRFDRTFGSNAIHRAERRINELLTGKTMSEARECVDAMVRDNISDEGIILREIAMNRGDVFPEARSMQLYFEEGGRLMEQPELSDPKLLQLLLGLLHNKAYLTQVLSDRAADHTCVTIGREHADRQLQPFSLVTAGYRMGSANGVLGIIGPTRMRYDLIYALVDSAARTMRAIGEEYF